MDATAAPPRLPLSPDSPFASLSDLVRAHAALQPRAPALADEQRHLSYAQLDDVANRIASGLQGQGIQPGEAVALCAANSIEAAAAFVGVLRAGAVVVPLPSSLDAGSFAAMLHDAGARLLFADEAGAALAPPEVPCVGIDSGRGLQDWMPAAGTAPGTWRASPEDPFNIIYSSGTTGTPKGIVQSHGMRWSHIRRGLAYGYRPDSRTLLSTPLYSNTTLVAFAPALGMGGCVHLMKRFDAAAWLATAQQARITHTMLVPIQYERLLDHPAFDRTDLSAFQMKFCTSAPFSAALKSEVLRRWPGGLVEVYGMTEGGGACILEAHRFPQKLHTVGQPGPGHDIRLIDEAGREVSGMGEVVGRSAGMMTGYHGRPELTRAAEWFDDQGRRYIRTGDVGRFDEDGFLILIDRRKDMLISGGFNLYPSDLEALLRQHPAVADVAVVGVPSRRWGETPVAWVVPKAAEVTEGDLLDWFNVRCAKTQRLAGLAFTDELPRSAIGKVLKRELRDRWSRPVA